MKSHEVIKKLQQINNGTANIKIIIDEECFDIIDIEWTGIENGNNIILKLEDKVDKRFKILRNALASIMEVWFDLK
jgi:hypothetical protein